MDLRALKQRFALIGNSTAFNHALSVAVRVAPTNLAVLINGESGVGKEVFSKIIHTLSPRKHNEFIAVNCGAIPEGTIDSELFGHEKGAFTGASDTRKGYFEYVNGGTIFLDEIGEMPLGTQARLLRILESGEFLKVGSSKAQKTDVRVIAATNKDLLELIQQGKFREDLYYRLNTVPIIVPPLRERKEDIHLLFRKFSMDFCENHRIEPIILDEEAQAMLSAYPWYGNIRELKNLSEQIAVLSQDRIISAEQLASFLPGTDKRANRLPIVVGRDYKDTESSFREREMLYTVLFEMRKDIRQLRDMVMRLGQGKGLENWEKDIPQPFPSEYTGTRPLKALEAGSAPIVIQTEAANEAEEVEESLSIADKERELIEKALRKHKGKRKDAALDLEIAERTLYRKIKQYNISI